jgi:hypothetical protein
LRLHLLVLSDLTHQKVREALLDLLLQFRLLVPLDLLVHLKDLLGLMVLLGQLRLRLLRPSRLVDL